MSKQVSPGASGIALLPDQQPRKSERGGAGRGLTKPPSDQRRACRVSPKSPVSIEPGSTGTVEVHSGYKMGHVARVQVLRWRGAKEGDVLSTVGAGPVLYFRRATSYGPNSWLCGNQHVEIYSIGDAK